MRPISERRDPERPLIDPSLGDAEDDVSSTKSRSLLAIAGSLLAEVSLPKLLLAWVLLVVVPAIVLGLAPVVASGWLETISRKFADPLRGGWPLLLFVLLLALAWVGGRPLYRMAEHGFWSLNSIAVQPAYALCREVLRFLMEGVLRPRGSASVAKVRAASAAGAGLLLCCMALAIALLAWPASRWVGHAADLFFPQRMILPALANATVILGLYVAAASLAWGMADATMDQPHDLKAFDPSPQQQTRIWRVAHLSDLHVVGERFGFRIESGRGGPRGNDRLARLLSQLDELHAREPLDLVLISGDMTDAGVSSEWAEFLGAMANYPKLAELALILPGNHDINIVDRSNPARLDLPTSMGARLRQLRTLSAMVEMQGDKVRIARPGDKGLDGFLSDEIEPHREMIAAFAETGSLRLGNKLASVWEDMFPMVLPPVTKDGLGVILINSTAKTHFSFTNALGFVSAGQAHRLSQVAKQFPDACWIVALHHHLVEYPRPGAALSVRIGTALINGSWFVRYLQSLAPRIVVMHGHRHIDWIGACGPLRIISAPSPVMDATDEQTTHFLIHSLAVAPDGRLSLLEPTRIDIEGRPRASSPSYCDPRSPATPL